MKSPTLSAPRLLATRRSLVERLVHWDDRRKWEEFFATYWKLIYSVAFKSGLTDAEAQDVVQETVITVAKNITKYELAGGSFRGWLLNITRWRISDQFRKRAPATIAHNRREHSRGNTATIERVPGEDHIRASWDDEWEQHIFQAALDRLKRKTDPRHYQIFDCLVVKHWPAARVAKNLAINVAQVYLVKHRLAAQLKQEVAVLEKNH